MSKTKDRPTSPLLTLKEASRYLNVNPRTLARWSDEGMIASYRVGDRGDRRFDREEVEGYIEAMSL